jgi:hypothetical protein
VGNRDARFRYPSGILRRRQPSKFEFVINIYFDRDQREEKFGSVDDNAKDLRRFPRLFGAKGRRIV